MKNTIIIILTALMAFTTNAVASEISIPAEQTTKQAKKKAEQRLQIYFQKRG